MKTIEQKFQKLDEISHVLARSGMYVGSTKTREEEVFVLNEDGKFSKRVMQFNPAFMKIFDEIVSNAADEHKRNIKLSQIFVNADKQTGLITISDNGGIPVVKHKDHDEWVPEMIFSNLRAGSNFDDSEERLVAGTNGVGATLTNIFSTQFRIRTCDGKNEFDQIFTENMRIRSEPKISKGSKGFTEISYIPDFSRFGLQSLDDDHIEMMRKRCADIAACNPMIRVEFNDEKFSFSSFSAYCRLYTENTLYEGSERWRIAVGASNGSMQQVSFVNGVETKDGGTHVDFVAWQIVEAVRMRLKKKHKIELKPAEIRNHMFVFVSCDIVNSSFSSQTKEKLITDPRDFGSRHELSDKFLKQVCESEMIQRILDWAQQKNLADERKKLRELNKAVAKEKVLKLIDAKGKNREGCTLALFEGDSASSSFRKYRDPQFQGAFPLRGKFLNVSEMAASGIVKNKEVKDIMTAMGLRMGEEPKELRYGKILIYADADPDGDSIAGLLVNFFGRYWPELLQQQRLFRVMTPLVVAKSKKEIKLFYTNEDFEIWNSNLKNRKEWDISYKKGLAALEDLEYKDIISSPKMFSIVPGNDMKQNLDNWFGSDATMRKKKILGEA
jgi:DNA topoisomerase-2